MTVERWTDETLDRFAATVATAIAANHEAIREATAASNDRLTRIEQIQESNARAIAANSEAITRIDERLEHFISSGNEQMDDLRAVTQAIGRDVAQLVSTQQQSSSQLNQAMIRLADTQEGIARLLANLDEDRPTILRKLNAIENKVDRLLAHQ
ncbi:hypothetical protein [Pseudanabaena sp. PCC 6802]|uniref:hypothetical protein n=1 Tax=Pseudanabaena sp. PCC 6802 TaxID=118173 RepID=UPI00034813F9|nr:hypothetical protein [Pseudanabaena sp. PCC 6802]